MANSATMVGNEDHLYDCTEASGALLDSVGSKNSTSGTTPSGDGTKRTFDGVNDFVEWTVAQNPWNVASARSGYMYLKWLDATDSSTTLYIAAPGGPDFLGLGITYKGSTKTVGFDLNNVDGNSTSIVLPREFTNTEMIAIAWSYNEPADHASFAIRSDEGLYATDTFTEGATPSSTELNVGNNSGATYANFELHEMGAVNDYTTDGGVLETVFDLLGEDMALTDGLVRWYTLDETTGTTITDSGSDGSDVTLSGTTADVITETGQVGTALSPDGVNDAMTNGALSLVDVGMTQDLSFSLWFKNVSPAGGDILFMAALSDNDNGFKIRYESAAYITCAFEVGGTFLGNRIVDNAWTVDGSWHQILVTYNASSGIVTTYYDGSASDAGGNGGGLGGASVTGLSIGCNPNSGENCDVALDEVCVWNRILTADEITEAYNLGDAGQPINGTLSSGVGDRGLTLKETILLKLR